jgi:hypothetical protein
MDLGGAENESGCGDEDGWGGGHRQVCE